MILQSWAEQLLKTPSSPDIIGLHVMDTVAAFLAGVRTKEGESLAALYSGGSDISERVAAAAAITRLSECDDIHLPSCVTPGAVVIPVALALGAVGEDFGQAVAAGYAAGLSLGMGIGGAKALAAGVWPTLLAAPLMAAVTASCLSGHDQDRLAHAMSLALAGSSGRLGRPTGAPSGRWFLLGEAVLRGLRASKAAGYGFRGDLALLSKLWLTAEAGHDAVDIGTFDSSAPASIKDVGYKPFPIARQGANAVVAFQNLVAKGLDPQRISTIDVFVPAMNAALLTRPVRDDDRLSRLSNIGFQLACAALAPELLYNAERAGRPAASILQLAGRVSVSPASDLEAHLPHRWAARVVVNTDSQRLEETVIGTAFDHDAPNLSQLLRDKWRRLLPQELWDSLDSVESPAGSHDRILLWDWVERCVNMRHKLKLGSQPVKG